MTETNWDILIIEDDELLAEAFVEIIESVGYQAQSCKNGTSALELLRKSTPDLIFLDMHLPGVSGMDILQYLKGDTRFNETEIIVVTADNTLRQEAENYTKTLFKPVSMDNFLNALNTAISDLEDKSS